ncbi:uncharacterized protein [Bemisia tabaci]|uniref:uncharacterized protein isoform X2 n=1 Tax=Bemisia tabaci TaxID=7038 RepID=UPI003B283169
MTFKLCDKAADVEGGQRWSRIPGKMLLVAIVTVVVLAGGATGQLSVKKKDKEPYPKCDMDKLEMWIDDDVIMLGVLDPISIIYNSVVPKQVTNPSFATFIIPAQIDIVTVSWCAGTSARYYYNFHTLRSFNTSILHDPWISIDRQGEIPPFQKNFSLHISCVGNTSEIATLRIGFTVTDSDGKAILGMPLAIDLKKECRDTRPDTECAKKCQNNGRCDASEVCVCSPGYVGRYCETPICFPPCENGVCTAPGNCSCNAGFVGERCDGGICAQKCQNGGTCIKKDTCKCAQGFNGAYCQISDCEPKCENGGTCIKSVNSNNQTYFSCSCTSGFYGTACELTKCLVQCINGGLCIGDDKCKCKKYFEGKHCEKRQCKRDCGPNGFCVKNKKNKNRCKCEQGWAGARCRKRVPSKNNQKQQTKKKNDI